MGIGLLGWQCDKTIFPDSKGTACRLVCPTGIPRARAPASSATLWVSANADACDASSPSSSVHTWAAQQNPQFDSLCTRPNHQGLNTCAAHTCLHGHPCPIRRLCVCLKGEGNVWVCGCLDVSPENICGPENATRLWAEYTHRPLVPLQLHVPQRAACAPPPAAPRTRSPQP